MPPKLIASDLDGTLILHDPNNAFNPLDTLPSEFFPLLDEMIEKGILFCAATGRSYSSVIEHFGEYASKICCTCENGAYIYSNGDLLEVISIPRELGRKICKSITPFEDCFIRINTTKHRYYLVHTEDQADLMRKWEYPDALTAFSFDVVEGDITQITAVSLGPIEPLAAELIPMWKDTVGVMIAGEHWLDFTCAGKGVGHKTLCYHLGIPLVDTVAIGDNFNDAEMLEVAGTPFIMDTASSDLLERFPNHSESALQTIRSLIN